MWKKLQDNPPFYLKFSQSDGYEILVTDYITLYLVYLSENEFLSVLKKSNPALEMVNEELIDKGTNLLSNMENLKSLSIYKEDSNLNVSMSKSYVYPFKLLITLKEVTKEIFFQKVTQPLLKTIKELQSIELELRQAIKEKDAEIEKYKEEGNKIRKHWRTMPFNEEEHLKKHEAYQSNFILPQDFPSSLLEQKKEITNGSIVKHEENVDHDHIKHEPMTPSLEEPNISHVSPKIEIKHEIKSETQLSSVTQTRKRKKKLNL
ncbi:unnamed protein product [Parnassius apollo]|uniref:(apollo) hypothetical protein n=1 Tax=Parnassius apollo TaxID=110799 RepID=A0A8S3WZ26_PARAO|nr:unnamed protein product [Parnassius apollo]